MEKLRKFLIVPGEIKEEFWQSTLKKNSISLLVISIMIVGMEAFNICRVLFWSRSGLGSVNNQIYFGMYCALMLAAVVSMILQHVLRHGSAKRRWIAQYGAILFFLLWHVCLNTYDLIKNPEGEILVFITAILGLAMFIQMPGLYSLFCYFLGYALFMGLAGPLLTSGTRVNLTFTVIVALAVSMTNCSHAIDILLQNRELDLANRLLQDLLQKDSLTEVLTKTAFQECTELCLASCGEDRPLTMLIADLDKFKLINDQYGHPCGDYVLKEMGRILTTVFAKAKGIGRIGGDEFAVVMDREENEAEERIGEVNRLLGQISWNGENLGACCSVGICRLYQSHVSYSQLYDKTDNALYAAKKQGKGQWYACEIR